MRKIVQLKGFVLILILLFSKTVGFGQAKLVLNGAKINLTNSSYLVLENPAPNAIIRNSGHIISEGEHNLVKWNTGNTTGTYQLPWGFGNTDYLPLTFTKAAGSGNGYYLFSTYHTSWQNSRSLPEDVTNLSNHSNDNSAFVLDRFWRIESQGYTTRPALTNVVFTYLESELNDSNNFITEGMLGVQGWNNTAKVWSGMQNGASINTTANTLTVTSLPTDANYNWWVLVDKASPLPLDLISFEARSQNKTVKLDWLTANESKFANFEIERSADAINFEVLATKAAKGGQQNMYDFIDNAPLNGMAYYRLKLNDVDGTFRYSPVRSVLTNELAKISFYPNPTESRTVQADLGDMPVGNYTVTVTDLKGWEVFAAQKFITQSLFTLEFSAKLNAGMYLIRIYNHENIAQAKLVFK